MDPNKIVCPRLDQIRREAFETSEFKAWLQTERVVGISNILNDIFGSNYWNWGCIMDCTMTAACTNREIPDGNGWVHMSDDILKEVTKQTESYWRHLFEYNQTEFSTLSMGNLAWQLRSHVESKLGILPSASDRPPITDGHKFHLFAAHDFTLLPLLTKMAPYAWDHTWPPYASMLTIELYSAQPSEQTKYGYLFRVVYNSKAFVLEGCHDSLCDVEVLLKILSFGKEVMPCGLHVSKTDQNGYRKDDQESECYMNQTDFSGYIALAIVFTGLISAGLTVAVYTFIFGISCKRFGYLTVSRELELDTVATNSMHASA